MKKLILALSAASLLAAPAVVSAKPKQTPEQKLAKLLEGRVAGKPVSCISLMNARDTQVFDKTAIAYNSGSVIYVNRPKNAASLDDDDILVTETHGSQLCRMDLVRLHERTGMWYSGFVSLDEFVPYRKVSDPG
ncbi:hypothetical protein [Novosphingobium sp. TH158]|uniref:hypothetical protein n=1 Tax=Novosphingobium sp. TH158 TaxID=2067455 RepID=UPI000C7D8251|nr:hypothetical protein [Novosphingobium sp. TH158]PLK27472.1 hypothetical protein C0V78_11665 [Novosphingobium sp. TH158]